MRRVRVAPLVLQSSAPPFAGIIAQLWLGERIGRTRAIGLAVGLAAVDPFALTTGSLGIAALALAPFAWATWPAHDPGA